MTALGSRDGAVVRALTSHQCGPGSIPGPVVICGLSLLLVFVLAPRGFSPGTLVFPSPQKPTFRNSNSIWSARILSNKVFRAPKCFVGKQIHLHFFTFYPWHSKVANTFHQPLVLILQRESQMTVLFS